MLDWQARVVAEKNELDARIERLRAALLTRKDLDLLQRDLMRRQLGLMEAYSLTLRERIDNFTAPVAE